MQKVAANEKSCSKNEKWPKSCRATCEKPQELNGAKEIEITTGTCVINYHKKGGASKPSLIPLNKVFYMYVMVLYVFSIEFFRGHTDIFQSP